MDAPQDVTERSGGRANAASKASKASVALGMNRGVCRGSGGSSVCAGQNEGAIRAADQGTPLGKANGGCSSSFFVVTAGVNREVKVWSAATAATGIQGAPPLSLIGYTIVGGGGGGAGSGGSGDYLTALELLSERFMACGFQSGAVEVWSIPFAPRGGVLATTREAAQKFPLAHGAKVTSIAVSVGIRFRADGAGSADAAGRVVLTTSADHTVVRWVAMPPGNNLRPMNRYCLSTEPTAAFLLPPPAASPGERETSALLLSRTAKASKTDHPDKKFSAAATAVATAAASTERFRVVAALDGMITVLELATATTLMVGGGGDGDTTQNQRLILENSFPGTPLVAKLPQRPVDSGSGEHDLNDCHWRVGGPRGREAGRYDVLGGTETLPLKDWAASGGKRLASSVTLRKAWHTEAEHCGGERGAHVELRQRLNQRGDLLESSFQRSLAPHEGLVPQPRRISSTSKRRGGGGSATRKSMVRRPAAVKPSVKTLTIPPQGTSSAINNNNNNHPQAFKNRGDCQAWGMMTSGDTCRQVRGGKTIKMDPAFAAAVWERMMAKKLCGGSDTHVLPQHGAKRELSGDKGVYSVELPTLTYTTSLSGNSDAVFADQSSSTHPRNAGEDYHQGSPAASPAQETTEGTWIIESGSPTPDGSPSALGSPPSPYPGCLQGSVHASEMLTLSEQGPDSSPRTAFDHQVVSANSASGGVISVATIASSAAAVNAREGGGEEELTLEVGLDVGKPNQKEEEGARRSFDSGGVAAGGVQEATTAVGEKKRAIAAGMNPVVAAVKVARDARHAQDVRGRLTSPMVVERLRAGREPRQPFNFDSTQAPSSGMLGVGVAVPKGFADARLKASKRRFTTSRPLSETTRRRFNKEQNPDTPVAAAVRGATAAGAAGQHDPKASAKVGGEAVAAAGQRESKTSMMAEAFPTSLVVSKHFRDTSSGREILMLEVAKVAARRNGAFGNAGGQSTLQNRSGRADRGRASGSADNASLDAAAAAAAAAAAEWAALSPRSRSLREMFESLSAGREILTQEALGKWSYVSRSVDRGLVSQYQVKSLFRQAHGDRHRGKMVWRDMVTFFEGMEAALDKACAPPLAEGFVVDSEEWDSISASVYLTKRGDVYAIALEGKNESAPPPSPLDVRGGGDGGGGTLFGGGSVRIIAAWAMTTVTNTDVPARLTLPGLSPECDYELYVYAENNVGREGGGRGRGGGGGGGEGGAAECGPTSFSVEPATSGMSQAQVSETRLAARTAREPDEELDVPWKDLSEPEKMAEALAALNDQAVARAARAAALDPPTAEDLAKCDSNPVSRNKWRSFCRWWAAGGGGEVERAAFLLRECVFAAQQPEILEEAARMGVQLLEGDWNASAGNDATAEGATTNPSARQRRWTAFRSWYRGGRVFDRAHESLITAAMLRRPPSPGSQGRPLTPHIAPADGPRPIAPDIEEGEGEQTPSNRGNTDDGGDDGAVPLAPGNNNAALLTSRDNNAVPVPLTPEEGMLAVPNAAEIAGVVSPIIEEGTPPNRRNGEDTGQLFLKKEGVHNDGDTPLTPKEEDVYSAPTVEAVVAGVDTTTAAAADAAAAAAALGGGGGGTPRGG